MSDVIGWGRVAFSLFVPFLLGLAVAWPFWRRPARDPVGSMMGAFVTLSLGLVLIGREYIHVQGIWSQCAEQGAICAFTPEPYVRYFLYIAVAMAQTFALFVIGARIEHRRRESGVSPQWRR